MIFCSRRPAGDAETRAAAIRANLTLRTAKRLQKTLLFAAFAFTSVAHANTITLDAALSRTLEKNPEIVQARLALEQAAGRRLVLRSTAFPDVKLQGLLGLQGGKRADEPTLRPFAFARGFFSQPLFDAAVPASLRRGNIEVLIAEQRLNVAIVENLHATRLAFYTALYDESLRSLGEAQRERLAQNVATQSERYRAGQSDRAAIMSAQLLERELDPHIQEARRGYEGALLTLSTAMGNPDDTVRPQGELQFAAINYDLASETSAALAQRADLQLARLLVRAAEEDQRIIEAQYYPALDAVVSGLGIPVTVRTANGGSASSSDDILSSEIAGGVSFTWRVLDNGRIGGQVARKRAIREMNEISLRQLEANAALDLKRIANNFRAIEGRWKSLTAAASGAEQNVNVVQRSLTEGLSSQLEFRTAESSFLETKGALLTAAYQQNIARAEWDRAIGRYFQFSNDTSGKVR
ncbi:MAG TPA: TolC family protein [Chthoniobacterales bacterium]|jgi:outer membrane protein TolC|nr:TolC family protein [Chthoniobacterales bacterium]